MRASAPTFLVVPLALLLLPAPRPADAALASASVPASERVFKCRGANASPVYQDEPCPDGRELRDFSRSPGNVSVIPFDVPAPARASKPSRPERAVKTAPKPDKRKLESDRRTNDAAVLERRHLKEGMSDAEVLSRLGTPDMQSGKTGRRVRWTYLPAPADPQTVTLVRFEDGMVIAVERTTMR